MALNPHCAQNSQQGFYNGFGSWTFGRAPASGLRNDQRNQREKWQQDVQDRQRSIVFPQTLANEIRLWRNIATGKPTALTWAGLALFGSFVIGFLSVIGIMLYREKVLWTVALGTLLIFGPVIGLIVWATRRNLRQLQSSNRNSRDNRR